MTQEEKSLLLKDLCGRLPYDLYIDPIDCGKAILIGIKDGDPLLWDTIHKEEYDKPWDIEYIKPYLRPLSSMTEEEKIKLYQIAGFYYLSNYELLKDEWRQFSDALSENELFLPYPIWGNDLQRVYDWLNENHFDYRGLIEKGLAIEAPEGMYNY